MKDFLLRGFRFLSNFVYKLLQKEIVNQCVNMDKKKVQATFKSERIKNERFINNKTIEISKEYDTLTLYPNITKIKMNSRIPKAMMSCNEFMFNNNIKMKILVRIYIFIKKIINKLNK